MHEHKRFLDYATTATGTILYQVHRTTGKILSCLKDVAFGELETFTAML
jgi:hypothetical protein